MPRDLSSRFAIHALSSIRVVRLPTAREPHTNIRYPGHFAAGSPRTSGSPSNSLRRRRLMPEHFGGA